MKKALERPGPNRLCRFLGCVGPPKRTSEVSLLVFFRSTNGHQTDLLAAQFDFKFISGFEIQKCCVGLANQQVSIALNCGDVAQLASAFADATDACGAKADTFGFQECLVESGEVQTISTVLFVGDVATGANQIGLAGITQLFDFVAPVPPRQRRFR